MNAFDEINYEKSEIRHQYNMMRELKTKLNKDKEMLELQIRENYVALITRKKSLYDSWIFGFVDFNKGIEMVNSYIQKLERKEIRRNEKCEEKNYYEIMKEHIESETGVKVKSIDEIIFVGYKWYYKIYFTGSDGTSLMWAIPNLAHERYSTRMYYPMSWGKDTTPDFDNLLDDLETKLYFIKEKTNSFIRSELITSFPNNIQKFEDFGKRFDEWNALRNG